MKHNAPLVSNLFENSFLFKIAGLFFRTEEYDRASENSSIVESTTSGKNTIFSAFWERLIHRPASFTQSPNASISSILEEDKGISASGITKSILAKKLNIPQDSPAVLTALEESNKIFHEDYPADFILEYQGERLGMALLDVCFDCNNTPKPVYKFNESLTSFNGIF